MVVKEYFITDYSIELFRYYTIIVKSETKYILCLLFFLLYQVGYSQYYYEYSPQAKIIYDDIIDLKLADAKAGVIEMQESEPNNLSIVHLENYIDFFELFITEDYDLFEKLEKNKSTRLDILDDKLADSDPYKKFAQAEINLQWALARSKFDQLFKASREVLTAYNLLEENQEDHPEFIYNYKSLSIIHSLIETITLPGLFKKILGIRGSIEEGVSEIKKVIDYSYDTDFIFTAEADAIYTFILFYQLNDQEEGLDYILNSRLDPKESLLSNFLVSKILRRAGHNEMALKTLLDRPQGEAYADFYYLDYMEGLSLLYKIDTSSVSKINDYIENFGGRHYIKEAYQKLAWAALVFEEDIPAYKYYMSQVQEEGYDLLDDDKQALKESKRNEIPNPILLRARLLFDGGYHEKAHTLLTRNAYKYANNELLTLEFNYRLGRVCQALGNYPDAIKYFINTINNGTSQSSYYACNAALQLAYIYEDQGMEEAALSYYKKCLQIKPTEYKSSLHQKAKTGMNRMK